MLTSSSSKSGCNILSGNDRKLRISTYIRDGKKLLHSLLFLLKRITSGDMDHTRSCSVEELPYLEEERWEGVCERVFDPSLRMIYIELIWLILQNQSLVAVVDNNELTDRDFKIFIPDEFINIVAHGFVSNNSFPSNIATEQPPSREESLTKIGTSCIQIWGIRCLPTPTAHRSQHRPKQCAAQRPGHHSLHVRPVCCPGHTAYYRWANKTTTDWDNLKQLYIKVTKTLL